ncbi:MAG: Asp-tRNA(Asn)/Glu-tRNA(Gln) amidotransferase subunit GatA [Simkaniaceae bacterium]
MLYKKSANEIHELFISGQVSASEIARHFLARIDKFDPEIGAFLAVFHERVLDKAQKLDKKREDNEPLGRLAGVPVAIKDNIQIKNEKTTCASKFLENYIAPFDATVVAEIEKEDGLIIGKTNLDEFAMGSSTEYSAFHPTKNPWQLEYTPGGSSGGSAAAVSANLVPIALGSDTGGSIRQPAAFTGTVGFKPSYGRVSRNGLVAFGSSFDVIGPFTNSVKDAAMIMEVMGRSCPFDSTSLRRPPEAYLDELETSIRGKKIGIPWEFLKGLSEEVTENFSKSLKYFSDLGAIITEVKLNKLSASIPVYYILSPAEVSTNLARFDGVRYGKRSPNAQTLDELYELSRSEGFGAEVKKRIMLGTFVLSSGYKEAYYKKAQKIRTLIIQEFKEAFEACDVIAMPTTPTSAFKIGEIRYPFDMYLQDIYTISANLAGLPAVSVPSGYCKEKRPLGLQILGPQKKDSLVMNFAYHLEQEADLNGKIPPAYNREVTL